jgi:hypothetical protein
MKNMAYYFKRSFLSEDFAITINANKIGTLLKEIGKDRKPITDSTQKSQPNLKKLPNC